MLAATASASTQGSLVRSDGFSTATNSLGRRRSDEEIKLERSGVGFDECALEVAIQIMIRVITIEREYGCGAAEIARGLSDRLGWKL